MPRSRKQPSQTATIWTDAPWISRRPAAEKQNVERLRLSGDVLSQENSTRAEESVSGRTEEDLDCIQHSLSKLTFTQCTTGNAISPCT